MCGCQAREMEALAMRLRLTTKRLVAGCYPSTPESGATGKPELIQTEFTDRHLDRHFGRRRISAGRLQGWLSRIRFFLFSDQAARSCMNRLMTWSEKPIGVSVRVSLLAMFFPCRYSVALPSGVCSGRTTSRSESASAWIAGNRMPVEARLDYDRRIGMDAKRLAFDNGRGLSSGGAGAFRAVSAYRRSDSKSRCAGGGPNNPLKIISWIR